LHTKFAPTSSEIEAGGLGAGNVNGVHGLVGVGIEDTLLDGLRTALNVPIEDGVEATFGHLEQRQLGQRGFVTLKFWLIF
jgi:hypothetical protein